MFGVNIFVIFLVVACSSFPQETVAQSNGPIAVTNDLKTDFRNFLSPFLTALTSAKPLHDLAIEIVMWIDRNIIGQNYQAANNVFQAYNNQLKDISSTIKSEGGMACLNKTRNLLTKIFELTWTDSTCLLSKKEELKIIITGLRKAIFPAPPTAACPIPILCKLDLSNLSFALLQHGTKLLKALSKHGVDLLKLIVYFKPSIMECNNNMNRYKTMSDSIVSLGKDCAKI